MLRAAAAIVWSFSTMAEDLLSSNHGDGRELTALPHMDTVLAEIIIRNCTVPSIKDLHDLLGADMDEDQFEALYATVFMPINLNSTCESGILLITGVGDHMAREFEEYRPYSNIEQFRLKSASTWMKRK